MQIDSEWLLWGSLGSFALLIVGLVIAPLAVARLPVDYFQHPRSPPVPLSQQPGAAVLKTGLRNIAASVVIVAGIAMLVLPGQGLLTIVVGVLVSDFRWKRTLLDRLVSRRGIQHALNLLRKGMGKPSFEFPETAAR